MRYHFNAIKAYNNKQSPMRAWRADARRRRYSSPPPHKLTRTRGRSLFSAANAQRGRKAARLD